MAARCTTPAAAMHHFCGMGAPWCRCRSSGGGVCFARSGCRITNGQGVVLARRTHSPGTLPSPSVMSWTHRWSKESPWTRCGMLWVLVHTWRPSAGTKASPLSAASTTRKRIYASQGMQSSTSTSALIRCLSSLVPFTTSPRLNRKRQDREPVRLPILSFLFAYFSKSMCSVWLAFGLVFRCAIFTHPG